MGRGRLSKKTRVFNRSCDRLAPVCMSATIKNGKKMTRRDVLKARQELKESKDRIKKTGHMSALIQNCVMKSCSKEKLKQMFPNLDNESPPQ